MKEEIIFFHRETHHGWAIHPIYEAMKEKGYDVMEMEWHGDRLVKRNPKFVVATSLGGLPFEVWSRAIGYTYGLGLGDCGCFREAQHLKGFMFNGTWWKKRYLGSYHLKLPPHHAVVGWAKSDLLFKPNAKEIAIKLLNRLGGKLVYPKTVYYVMCESGYPSRVKALRILISCSKEQEFNLIIRPHPLFGQTIIDNKKVNFSDYIKTMKGIEAPHISLLPQYGFDMTILFSISDIMVNEWSSALWEFLATGRPVLQITSKPYMGCVAAPKVELPSLISQYLEDPDINKEERDRVNNMVNRADGHVCDRAVKFLEGAFNL